MDTIHGRILTIIEKERLSISKFEKTIGAGTNVLSTALRRKSAISHVIIQNIVKNYPNYSISWLVLGEKESPKEQILNKVIEIIDGI